MAISALGRRQAYVWVPLLLAVSVVGIPDAYCCVDRAYNYAVVVIRPLQYNSAVVQRGYSERGCQSLPDFALGYAFGNHPLDCLGQRQRQQVVDSFGSTLLC